MLTSDDLKRLELIQKRIETIQQDEGETNTCLDLAWLVKRLSELHREANILTRREMLARAVAKEYL